MRVSLIVAMSSNRVIGRDGDLPWRLSADLRRFKSLTMDHHIVMGRKTYESIGRALPGRTMLVVTRQAGYEAEFGVVAGSLDEALSVARDAGDCEAFIIGGGEIYTQALPLVDRVYLTRVQANIAGDTHFPEVNFADWHHVEEHQFPADEKNDFPHTFAILSRKHSAVKH